MRALALVTLTFALLIAGSSLLGVASPVGTASANCTVVLDDGSCTNPCMIVAGVVNKVDPSRPVYCPE